MTRKTLIAIIGCFVLALSVACESKNTSPTRSADDMTTEEAVDKLQVVQISMELIFRVIKAVDDQDLEQLKQELKHIDLYVEYLEGKGFDNIRKDLMQLSEEAKVLVREWEAKQIMKSFLSGE